MPARSTMVDVRVPSALTTISIKSVLDKVMTVWFPKYLWPQQVHAGGRHLGIPATFLLVQ